jgi:arylsulfatase A-like enzyme
LASSIDLAPTILAACGLAAKKTEAMQGVNLLNPSREPRRDTIFGEIFSHDVDVDRPGVSLLDRWVIQDHWKLIASADGKRSELYNLSADPHEKKNRANDDPKRVAELRRRLDQWWKPDRGTK